jgi:hypothetical protein
MTDPPCGPSPLSGRASTAAPAAKIRQIRTIGAALDLLRARPRPPVLGLQPVPLIVKHSERYGLEIRGA